MTVNMTYHIESTTTPSPKAALCIALPRHLGGHRPRDLGHALGRRKAKRIVAWLTQGAGPTVIAFDLDRARHPATGEYRRTLPSKARLIVLPLPRGHEAA